MPVRLPLQAVPNQSFTTQLDDVRYSIRIVETRGVMSATIAVDDVVVISGARILADVPLIPYEYQEGDGGNFIFSTESENYPYYPSFDVTQFLFYLSAQEVADAR